MGKLVTSDNIPVNGMNQNMVSDTFAWTWAYDPISINAGFQVVNGTLYLVRMPVRELPTPFTDTLWILHTAGVAPVAGQNWSGLYSPNGELLVKGNIDGTLVAPLGVKNVVFGETGLSDATPSFVWGALLFNAATPPFVGMSGAIAANVSNFGIQAFPQLARFATNGTGRTDLPNQIAPTSNSPIAQSIFMAAG